MLKKTKEPTFGRGIFIRPSQPPKYSTVPRTSMTIKLETRVMPKKTRGPALKAAEKIIKAKSAEASPAVGKASQKENPAFVTKRADV